MDHPYKSANASAFWKRAVSSDWNSVDVPVRKILIRKGQKVASAGSCFAANIVPFIEDAGFEYIRKGKIPVSLAAVAQDNFSYSKFSAAYGNIYTARQAVQIVKRALGRFSPIEDRWVSSHDAILDPYRPGLKYPAMSEYEFDVLTADYLSNVIAALTEADVFIFTLGLTEAWVSKLDGAVFPACPGTVSGEFDLERHSFQNFSAAEVTQDILELVGLLRELKPTIEIVLTVSPVPLVATATNAHVLEATTYSKAVLRVAAGEVAKALTYVTYFPAYEIVCGPQAPHDFFETDRRQPSQKAIGEVMRVFLSRCETLKSSTIFVPPNASPESEVKSATNEISSMIAAVECEEAAAGISLSVVQPTPFS